MENQVYKIHSDFYYVRNKRKEDYICKLRDILKKQKINIHVGDFVELSEDKNFITNLTDRKNFIKKPKVANIDYAVIIVALKEPELNLIQLNRYLTYLKYNNIDCIICFNKVDLINDIDDKINSITSIYEKLKYKIFFISAKNKSNLDELKKYIENKTIVFCGQSGVGKSTLLNDLVPNIYARTGMISKKNQRGIHTTRHCEMIKYNNYNIIDTPGFSCLKFDFLLPNELLELFDDIKIYAKDCKYTNCLHNNKNDTNCSIIKNLDKISSSRYESYLTFLNESLEYKNLISNRSIKNETQKKQIGSRTSVKISKRKRVLSRNTTKQNIKEH